MHTVRAHNEQCNTHTDTHTETERGEGLFEYNMKMAKKLAFHFTCIAIEIAMANCKDSL